ncbi:MAG TPA: hypothetical protein VGM44_09965 [Polyangiaceae bacterium]
MPALAVTAYPRLEDKRRALAEGFQVHFAKPDRIRRFCHPVARLSRGLDFEASQ